MAEEVETTYRRVQRIQARVRRKNDTGAGLPGEDEQFLVWLEGVSLYFFVPLKDTVDRTAELELIGVLREAFMHDKRVKLGYRVVSDDKYISAAWVQHP